jgi:O-antigen ligase
MVALQALVLGLPLMLGGRSEWALALACPLVLTLLAVTVIARQWRGGPAAPALWALAGFVALALATTVPVPPALLRALAPATARLYADMLPGWPGGGGWSASRSVAIDPYGVWLALCQVSIGVGAFAVLVAYPWQPAWDGEDARQAVFARVLLTLLAGGVLVAAAGLVGTIGGSGQAPWVSDRSYSGRMSGPFVNPNHFAAWLEMIVPVALAYALAVAIRVRRRLTRAVGTGQGMGVRRRQAWAAALIAHQRRLSVPLVALTAAVAMAFAHKASGSRGGTAALLTGLAVTGAGLAMGRLRRTRGWLPAVCALALFAVSGATLLRVAASEVDQADVETIDEGLGSRFAASAQGIGVLRDHLLLGTGLGSWLHAFRLYQAPPIDDATWDHAHDDYVELAAETGLAGITLVALFGLAVLHAARHGARLREQARRPRGFEEPEWLAALRERTLLRWGLAGGVAAILIHSLVDFSLRMPANLLCLMILLGLLVLSGRPEPTRPAPQLALLLLLLAVAAVPVGANGLLSVVAAAPLSPESRLRKADVLLAEQADGARAQVTALARGVIDFAPVYREAHELLAAALGPGPAGDDALRRAIALQPCATELRDRLAARFRARGEYAAGAAELEESVVRAPYLDMHAYLMASAPQTDQQALRAFLEGTTTAAPLAALEPDLVAAMERGLERALAKTTGGAERLDIVGELATLREARGQWGEAAALIRAEGERSADRGIDLARAARDYLRANETAAAESALVAALLRAPEEGTLYRKLAVEVYAQRGDFEMAERVLRAGERNAADMMPVYQGVKEVLARQQVWLAQGSAPDPERPRVAKGEAP